jgi:hypothetical protein
MARFREKLRVAVVGAGAALAWLLLPAAARANIGPRWWGDLAAEPRGLKQVAISREELTIDLRPLAAVDPARVKVVYHLHNPGERKKLNLLFVSGAPDVQDFEVRLDDRPVPSKPLPGKDWDDLPAEWKPPRYLPGIHGRELFATMHGMWDHHIGAITFSVEIPPGASTLRVRYRARAAGATEGHTTATWLFPYVLAPAKAWAGFGTLEVTVYLPEGWEHHSEPPLEREGDVLRGHFTGLPADTLALAVRAPVGPAFYGMLAGSVVLFALAAVGGWFLCGLAGRLHGGFLARKVRPGPRRILWLVAGTLPVAVLLPVGWALLIFGAGYVSARGLYAALAGQQPPDMSSCVVVPFCSSIILILFALPAGFWITCRGAYQVLAGPGDATPDTAGLPGGGGGTL